MNDARTTHKIAPMHWRLLNTMIATPGYMGNLATEATLLEALQAQTVKVIDYDANSRPLVIITAKGLRCHKAGARSSLLLA